jgi:hypothetical protein
MGGGGGGRRQGEVSQTSGPREGWEGGLRGDLVLNSSADDWDFLGGWKGLASCSILLLDFIRGPWILDENINSFL